MSPRTGAKATPVPAPDTEGLDALDRDRAASLADEGGVAGAVVESQESQPPPVISPIALGLTAAAGVLTAVVAWRLLRR